MAPKKANNRIATKKKLKCPSCGSKQTVQYNEKTVCLNCSLVIDPVVIKSQKSNTKDSTNLFPQATPENPTKPFINIDPGEEGQRRWQKLLRVSDATEKRLATTLFEITRIGQNSTIPESTLKLAIGIYRKIVRANLTRRKAASVLAAAIIYLACRQDRIPVSLNQIGHLSKINPDKIRRIHNTLFKELRLGSNPTSLDLHLHKIATSLFHQEKTIETANKIIYALKDQKSTQGRNPIGLVCAACYISSILTGESRTQREIAEVGRITEETLRSSYREISKHLLFKFSF